MTKWNIFVEKLKERASVYIPGKSFFAFFAADQAVHIVPLNGSGTKIIVKNLWDGKDLATIHTIRNKVMGIISDCYGFENADKTECWIKENCTGLVKLAYMGIPTRKFQVYLFSTPILLSVVSSKLLNTGTNF